MSNKYYEKLGDRFDHLAEECAELIKEIMKAKRFGFDGCHPKAPHLKNTTRIVMEINDVQKRINEVHPILEQYEEERLKQIGSS